MELNRAEKVIKNYPDTEVLKGMDLTVREGEFIGIMGKSGSCLLYTSPSPRD